MEKNNTLNYFVWIVVFLIVAMGAWIVLEGGGLGKEAAPYTVYNGYVIYEIKDNKSLRYNVQVFANNGKEYVHIFKTYPADLLDLNYDLGVRDNILYKNDFLKKDKIYFSYDPEMKGEEILTAGTLIQLLGTGNAGVFGIPTVISVLKDNGNPDFPIKTCSDATSEIGVIELRYGEPKLYSEGECVIMQGMSREDFINYNDLLSYILLGVIE